MIFDGPNKLVILSATTLDLQVLWSDWKDWLLAGNAGYARALDTVGGESIDQVAGTIVPLYLFVLNGWKFRPMESDHTLYVTNGALIVSGGGDPFVSTLGDYVVRIVYQQPVQAIGCLTSGSSGPSAYEIANAVRTILTQELLKIRETHEYLGLSESDVTISDTAINSDNINQSLIKTGDSVIMRRN